MSKWKEKTQKLIDSGVRLMSNPYIRKVSRFAATLLETTSYVDFNNPLSVAVAGISTIDLAIDSFDMPLPTKTDQWISSAGLVMRWGHLGKFVVSSGIIEDVIPKIVCLEDKVALKELSFDFGSFYYVENIDLSAAYTNDLNRLFAYSYATKDFDFQKLFDLIWNRFPNGIYLSLRSAEEEVYHLGDVDLCGLSTSELFYLGENPNVGDFAEEIKLFKNSNISRSYMLVGSPGVGKTSFAVQASNSFTHRVLKIDPSIARQLNSGHFEFIVKNLAPEVLLFDDFDRAAGNVANLLFLLENIKQQFPEVLIFATVNDFDDLDDAIKRPGRFDRTIWFDLPKESDREVISKHYLDKYKVECDEDLLQDIVSKTEGMSPAFIKELCVRLGTQGITHLEDIVIEFKRTIGKQEEEEEEEEDE